MFYSQDKVTIIGYVLGIMSSLFYLGSRLAQIYKNVNIKLLNNFNLNCFHYKLF